MIYAQKHENRSARTHWRAYILAGFREGKSPHPAQRLERQREGSEEKEGITALFPD